MAGRQKQSEEAGTELTVAEYGQVMPEFLGDIDPSLEGLGNSTDASDNALPFLGVVQKGSPQVNRQKPEYIPGVEAGDLLNTATGRFWKGEEGVAVVPFWHQKNWVEWVPREEGGGYVATYPWDPALPKRLGARRDDNGRIVLESGHHLVETFYTFVLVQGSAMPLINGASSTHLGPMRQWMTMRNEVLLPDGRRAPAFARGYQFSTVYKENEKGDWYIPKIRDLGWVTNRALYERAREFALMAAEGRMVVGRPDDVLSGSEGGGSDPDVPF